MTRIFGNPGSTEIPFLTDLPGDFEFVLALHEGSVVGIASGYALATGEPAFVNLHTAPGLGNAGNAIAAARDSRAPLVIVVGQQDRAQPGDEPVPDGTRPRPPRRHLPGLDRHAGAPAGPAGRDRPRLARGAHRPRAGARDRADGRLGGSRPTPTPSAHPSGCCSRRASTPPPRSELADLIEDARSPVIVVGAGADERGGLGRDASRSPSGSAARSGRRPSRPRRVPAGPPAVGRPPAVARARGCVRRSRPRPRDRARRRRAAPLHLRARSRSSSRAPASPSSAPTRRSSTAAPRRSRCSRRPVRSPAPSRRSSTSVRSTPRATPLHAPPPAPAPPAPGEPLSPGHVLDALARRLPADAILVEESPSSRPELLERMPARDADGLRRQRQRRPRLRHHERDRAAHGRAGSPGRRRARRRLDRCTRSSRCGRRPATVSACCAIVMANGSLRGDGRARRRAGRRGRLADFEDVEIAPIARALGCAARAASSATTSCCATLDEVDGGPRDAQRAAPARRRGRAMSRLAGTGRADHRRRRQHRPRERAARWSPRARA